MMKKKLINKKKDIKKNIIEFDLKIKKNIYIYILRFYLYHV